MSDRPTTRLTAVLLVAVLVGAAFTVAAYASSHDDAQNRAYLRVAHASPDVPAVDGYVDNESLLEDVEFGDVSDFLEVSAGLHSVEITAAGDRNATVFDGEVSLDRGTATAVAASGELSANGTVITTVDVSVDEETTYTAWAIGYVAPDEAPADTPFAVQVTEDASLTIMTP